MKRFVAILLAAMLLFSVSAMAENVTTLFENEAGIKVTLTGDFNAVADEHNDTEYAVWTISREGCADVIVIVNAATEEAAANLNDLTDEEVEDMRANLEAMYATEASYAEVTVETTAAGNKYFNIVVFYIGEDGEAVEYLHERYTIFEGFDFDRLQLSTDAPLTADDEVFMNEVQAAMWVEVPAAAE